MSKYYHKDNPDGRLTLVKKGDDQNMYKDDDGNEQQFPHDEIVVREHRGAICG